MSEKRLIDADALLQDMKTICNRSQFGRQTAKMCVKRAPTVDAVAVVRCRDCIHAKPIPFARRRGYFDPDGLRHCALMRTEADAYGVCALHEDCYCDEGERKEAADGRSD